MELDNAGGWPTLLHDFMDATPPNIAIRHRSRKKVEFDFIDKPPSVGATENSTGYHGE
ncbi:hypothetical protein [Mesorhizobium sp.]|uniref:hypothetical protein n=1 Tax=Mesorhizobium sp. TaxID=1871066 RepID=UPI0025C33829|nr:hypothetical protein [Mesorhizobium sp.]